MAEEPQSRVIHPVREVSLAQARGMIPYQQYETGGLQAYHPHHMHHAYAPHSQLPQDQGELPRYSRYPCVHALLFNKITMLV